MVVGGGWWWWVVMGGGGRRMMSVEVISMINELVIEFFATAAATTCALILKDSDVLTEVESDLTFHVAFQVVVAQYVPDLLIGWGIVVYISRLGVDWSDLAAAYWQNKRLWVSRVACVPIVSGLFFLGIMRRS